MPDSSALEHRSPTPEEQAERYRQIFEQSNDAILIIDPAADQILEANPRASAMPAHGHEELLCMPITDKGLPDVARAVAEPDARPGARNRGWSIRRGGWAPPCR